MSLSPFYTNRWCRHYVIVSKTGMYTMSLSLYTSLNATEAINAYGNNYSCKGECKTTYSY